MGLLSEKTKRDHWLEAQPLSQGAGFKFKALTRASPSSLHLPSLLHPSPPLPLLPPFFPPFLPLTDPLNLSPGVVGAEDRILALRVLRALGVCGFSAWTAAATFVVSEEERSLQQFSGGGGTCQLCLHFMSSRGPQPGIPCTPWPGRELCLGRSLCLGLWPLHSEYQGE